MDAIIGLLIVGFVLGALAATLGWTFDLINRCYVRNCANKIINSRKEEEEGQINELIDDLNRSKRMKEKDRLLIEQLKDIRDSE